MIGNALSPAPSPLTFVSGFWQARVWLVVAAVVAGMSAYDLTSGSPAGTLVLDGLLITYLVVMYLLERRRATVATDTGLVLRGYVGTDHVPWERVASVRPVSKWGMRRVALLLDDGRARILDLPRDQVFQRDHDFDAKAAELSRALAEHKGR